MQSDKKIKICMVTTISGTFDAFISDSAKNFAKKGFDVTIMCGDLNDDFIRRHSDFATVKALPIVRGMSPVSMLKSIRKVGKIFKEEKFDIIQYSTPNAALSCTLARNFKKIPIRIYGQWGMRYVGFKGLSRFFFKTIEKIVCRGATHISAVSGKNRELAIAEKLCPEDKIFLIGKGGTVGVDLKKFDIEKKAEQRALIRQKLGIKADEFLFGFVARLTKDKGTAELIAAFKKLSKENHKVKLMMVGRKDLTNPPDKNDLQWAMDSDRVILTEKIPSEQIASYMSAVDIFVHPTYREGFSMVLQEAMAMELPIITTDVPGPCEVITEGKTGVLVPAKNAEALYREMKALMNDPVRCERFAKDGRRRVELFFARPIMLRNIHNKYCELLGLGDRKIKLMYLTSNPSNAKLAQDAGVDRIFLDLEVLGKEERQGHLDTVVSHSSLEDVPKLRRVLKDAELVVRCNPVHEGLSKEIDSIIDDGADMIILPYFKTVDEVREFLSIIGGRVRTMLLFETKESVECADEILALEGIDEAFVGLNDLHLSYGKSFMFELLTQGTVEALCEKFKKKGIPFGFGGIAKIGEGAVQSQYIIHEHKRIGSTCAILSRTFRNEVNSSRPIDDMSYEIDLIRQCEKEAEAASARALEENRKVVCDKVNEIVKAEKEKVITA